MQQYPGFNKVEFSQHDNDVDEDDIESDSEHGDIVIDGAGRNVFETPTDIDVHLVALADGRKVGLEGRKGIVQCLFEFQRGITGLWKKVQTMK